MTMRVTMLQTRLGDAGSYLTAGSTYTVTKALGAVLVGSGFATDIDGSLLAGVFKSIKAVTASRSLDADDNGATLDVSDTVALTVPAGLPADFGCAIIPTGTITIVSGGGTLLNGATTTLSRTGSATALFQFVARAGTANSYLVSDLTASGGGFSSLYLGPVATRAMIPNAKHPSNKQGMFRSIHFARDNITALQVAYANWWYSAQTENLPGGSTNWRASIEYPVGSTPQRFLFGGSTTGTSADGETILSDLLTLTTAIPSGAQFALNVWQDASAQIIYNTTSAYITGDRLAVGATTPDLTATGGASFGGASNGAMCHPVAILAQTRKPTVALLGDSTQLGAVNLVTTNFAGNGYGDQGMVARAIGPALAYINLGSYGDRAQTFISSGSTRRKALVAYCSHIVCNFGINDVISAARTSAQLIADLTTIAGYFPTLPFWQQTLTPCTTSSDSFATTVNQTVTANEAQRVAFNLALRGGVTWAAGSIDTGAALESSWLSGVWQVPTQTVDGTHPNVLAQIRVASLGAINPALFTR